MSTSEQFDRFVQRLVDAETVAAERDRLGVVLAAVRAEHRDDVNYLARDRDYWRGATTAAERTVTYWRERADTAERERDDAAAKYASLVERWRTYFRT